MFENIVEDMLSDSNYGDHLEYTILNFVNSPKQALTSCRKDTKEMIDETNGGIVYFNFDSYSHYANKKLYVEDFDNDKDVLNLDEISLYFHAHDETNIVANFLKATPPMLCFIEIFECVEERPHLGHHLKNHQHQSSSHYPTIFNMHIWVIIRLQVIISSKLGQD